MGHGNYWHESKRSGKGCRYAGGFLGSILMCFWSVFAILREGWFTVAIFGLFFILFLARFYCQLLFPGSKNEAKTKWKTSQKQLKNTTVSTPIVLDDEIYEIQFFKH